jgi:starch-binding outer membrane protein, SusD/RagB family
MQKNTFIRQAGIVLLVTATFFSQVNCKKFLDRKPLGQAIDGDVKQGGVEDQIFSLYADTKNWGMTSLPFLTAHASRADDNLISTAGDGNESYIDQFQYTKDYWLLDPLWDDHLAFVAKASGIIKDVDSLYAKDSASLINKAEASFLRAYGYFDMVRDYGDVPKIDFKVYSADQANVPRAPAAVIYALIDADLQYAAQLLPLKWESKYAGRATRGAANTLRAKTYLYRKNWAVALTHAETVINSAQYALLPNYADVFTEENENSTESIFEVQNYENANGSVNYSNNVAQYQGVRGSGQWDLGWGWNIPSNILVSTGYESGDPRKGQTILFSGAPDDSLANDGKFGAILPVSPTAYWNKKAYTNPARRAATGDHFGNWLDMIIIRYPDVLLMAAEAANESGNTAKALTYLEKVRARARNGKNVLAPVVSVDPVVVRRAIKQERRAEFAMEFERFYDLVRWGDAPAVLGPLGYTPKNALLPIPQGAIDKSNKVLTQNPGY